MLKLIPILAVWIGVWLGSGAGLAGEYHLTNGNVYKGEAASFDDEGLVVRLDIGGFSPRIPWTRLTQETLKELAKIQEANRFVDPFIELTPEQQEERKEKKEIIIKEVPRLERPERSGLLAALPTPAGLMIFIVFYLANLYAAYEIAVYRQRPAALVCGVSAIAPLVGPIIFLSMPSTDAEMVPEMEGGPEPSEVLVANPMAGGAKAGPAPSSLGLASAEKKVKEGSLEGQVFKRGETTFNRRFFETKFSGFFRVIPTELEKDLVLVVRAGKKEFVGKRISRISSNEFHLQMVSGATEVSVAFADINEILIRRKDAKG